MKFSSNDFFSKCDQIRSSFSECDQIRSFLRIWSHLLKKSLMANFIFWVVIVKTNKLSKAESEKVVACLKLTAETLNNVWNMFKVNNRDARTTPSGVFIVNFEHISHYALVFLLLNLSKKMPTGFIMFYLEKNIWMSSLQSLDDKKKTFPLRISSVNVTKAAVFRILNGKHHFLWSE